MPPRILASADIGSNTVHMLVAEVENGQISRIGDTNEWISLGEIVGLQKKVPQSLTDRLIKTLDSFRRTAASQGAEGLYVFGTEAVRKASNQKQVLSAIQLATGVKVEIITGEREAELGLRGAWLDCYGTGPFVMTEVGGGSAQIAQCSVDSKGIPSIQKDVSLPLGTGTLIAELALGAPCSDDSYKKLVKTIEKALGAVDLSAKRVVACGGVVRGIWRALHPDGDREIAIEELDYLIWTARRLALDVIVDRFQVKPKRAATLLPGATVYRTVLEKAGQERMTVSRFGVREGAILEMAEGLIKPSRV